MSLFDRLLVATDFSKPSLHAVEAAARLARVVQPQVTLFHAVPPLPLGRLTPFVPVGEAEPTLDRARERALADLEAVRRRHFDGVSRVDVLESPHRSAAAAVCNTADALEADLVVLGTHGLSGLSRLAFGSVAEKVVRHAGCPVLVVPPDFDLQGVPPRHVLCGIDFSSASPAVLAAGRAFSRTFGARLTLLHAVEDRVLVTRPLEAAEPRMFERHQRAEQAAAHERLASLRQEMPDLSEVQTDSVVATRASDAICAYARAHAVDLTVVGTLGRTGLSRMLIGSVAEQVVRQSPNAVLTLRA